MDKSLIQIFRGDDTDGLGYQSIQGKITTTLDLTGCRAVFRYLGFTQEFDPIPENGRITITIPASATSKFPPGLGYASLRVYDSEGKVRTFTNRIPVFVTVYAPSECGGEFEVVFNGGNLELEPLKIKSVNGYRIYDGYLEQIIDKATAIEYGLALLFDSGDLGKDANSGYAATPKAVQAAYDAIIGELTDNYYNAEETEEAIDRIAAYYITSDAQGSPFATYAALAGATAFYSGGQLRTPTRNDYCVVLADETHEGKQYRYIYSVNQQGVGQWEAQYAVGGSVELDNTVTRTSGNGVKSSGIWSAIWGALTAVPGFSSLYDWCVAQLAGKASKSDATLTPIEFTEWTLTADLQEVHFDFYGYTDGEWYFVSDNPEAPFNVTFEGSEKAVYLEVVYNDQTWVASRKALGYILGSEDQSNPNYNKPLQPKGDYAPATNIARSALAQDVQASLDKADSALPLNGGRLFNDSSSTPTLIVTAQNSGVSPFRVENAMKTPESASSVRWVFEVAEGRFRYGPNVSDFKNFAFPSQSGTLALLSDIAVKSVKLNGTAITPDANGAVDVQALGNSGNQTLDGRLEVNNSLSVTGEISIVGDESLATITTTEDALMITSVASSTAPEPSTVAIPLTRGDVATFMDVLDAVQQIAPAFTAKAYVRNELCTYNGVVYRCKFDYTATASSPNPNADTTHWEAKKVSELFAPLASPAFTGTPTAPTPDEQSADTQIATKKYVDDAVAGGGGGNLDYVMRVDPETGGIYYTTPDTNA